MKVSFTKMQGAGNDFVVLDETRERLDLSAAQYRFLADRHFGIGADQILSIRQPAPSSSADKPVDFSYVIHNADGNEVEHCGNGARCFVRYVTDKGLTSKSVIRVQTVNRHLELRLRPDGTVTVDMDQPKLGAQVVAFDTTGLPSKSIHHAMAWSLPLKDENAVELVMVSMGNPHAVQVVDNVNLAPVERVGPLVSLHPRFAHGVNAGFMQIMDRNTISLRVYERGAGETLACGTGACAAVVAGIAQGLLNSKVDVHTRGGMLTLQWSGAGHSVLMTGPATFVFDGEITLPDL
jgi:diaminopimelate epimerase